MRVVVKRVGQEPEAAEIGHYLSDMQAVVGGCIEVVPIAEGIDAVVNEDAIAEGLPENACGILGDFFICAVSEGEFRSLTDDEVRKAVAWVEKHKHERHPGEGMGLLVGEEARAYFEEKARVFGEQTREWESL